MDIKKRIDKESYKQEIKETQPKSNLLLDMIKAFLVGGAICVIGQLLMDWGGSLGLNEDGANSFRTIALVFLGALFTGLGVYDILGKFAGAGSIVPITGFANSIVAPAMEFKSEGLCLGVGAKLFTIAGPVLVFGISASVVYGIIYYIIGALT